MSTPKTFLFNFHLRSLFLWKQLIDSKTTERYTVSELTVWFSTAFEVDLKPVVIEKIFKACYKDSTLECFLEFQSELFKYARSRGMAEPRGNETIPKPQ